MPRLKGHDEILAITEGNFGCDACDDQSYSYGLKSLNCNFTVHEQCTFVFSIPETFEHRSHVGHCLKLLITGALDHIDPKCHICGKNTKRLLYHCSICKLNLDIECMVNDMCARAHLNMPWHHHPLLKLEFSDQMSCKVCGHRGGFGYFCPLCKLVVHDKCIYVFESPEITHPYHTKHSLKLLTQGAPDYTKPECHVCGRQTDQDFLYHCDICKFNIYMVCAIEFHDRHKLTPAVLSNMKVHEHTLTLVPRLMSFVCDGCGTKGNHSPYVSFHQGDLMFFHQMCARLPRVIHVSHHDHRVSYTYPLGPGEWECRICLDEIDWSYGAYSCSNYVLHSKCATREDVWDGKELDGVPEEVEDLEPFKLNNDKTITHFTHEHNMTLNKDEINLVESILCEACVLPIASNTFYSCSDCTFILHETCANLPKKKRHVLSPNQLILHLTKDNTNITCSACLQSCCKGFMYTDGNINFDLMCSSITVPFIHGSHPHPLLYLDVRFLGYNNWRRCHNCTSRGGRSILGCLKCNYFLDFRCATLPLTVRLPRYDDHPLTLCFGEKVSGKYWCDICERETNPETWFYTCKDCGVTLHIFCVLGNVRYPKPGGKIEDDVALMFNITSSRPLCIYCQSRCMAPFFVIKENKIFCSYFCLLRIKMRESFISSIVERPPWLHG